MLTLTLHTLRTRWITFAGSFVALSLGVALIAVMGLALASSVDAPPRLPERFAAAPVVVRGQDTLRVPTPTGDRTQRLARPNAVPAKTVAALRKLGTVTEDRSFAVRVEGGPDDVVGHPWSTAAFAPYELSSGRAPRAADEVVTSGEWATVGQRLRTGFGTVKVVGTVEVTGTAVVAARGKVPGSESQTAPKSGAAPSTSSFENAVFYTDATAARLSPLSTQLVVDADPTAVRRAVRGSRVSVLTGDDRRLADADPDRDAEALTAMNAMFGTAGGATGFVSVFVVASTFAFAVGQRRREFALLRTAGATPGQIRRTVLVEALLVGALASATGCVFGAYGAPYLAELVVDGGLAPAWFTIGGHTWPYQLAFCTGLLVALSGAFAASWRAGRTGPVEALREASVDGGSGGMGGGAMTWGRLLSGTALLITAAVTLALALLTEPGDLLHRKTYISRPMLLITAVALLSPLLVRPLTRLIAWLPAQLPGAGGMLVRENAAAQVRRTAAVAAPVLVTVALAGSLLGATATLNAAQASETRERTTADFVVSAPNDSGFDAATVERLRDVPGAWVSITRPTTVYVLEDGVALVKSNARAADSSLLAATARLPVTAGRVTDLDDDSVIVNEEWAQHSVGQRMTVWLGDGTRRSLRIAAVMATGTGDNGVYVTPANAPSAPVDRVDVRVRAGGDARTVATDLRGALGRPGGQVLTNSQWLATTYPEPNRSTRLGVLLVLGIALLYTGISLANTLVMATSDRVRELAVLRLTGATTGQVLRLVAAETLAVVAVGTTLGVLVTALNLSGMWGALALLSVWTPPAIPWAALAATTGACAALAVPSAVIPAALALRRCQWSALR